MTICQCDGAIMAAMLKIIGFCCHNRDNSKALWHHGKDGGDGGKDNESDRHRYGQDKKNEGRNYSHSRGPRIVVFKPTLYYETTNYLNI